MRGSLVAFSHTFHEGLTWPVIDLNIPRLVYGPVEPVTAWFNSRWEYNVLNSCPPLLELDQVWW